MGLRTKARRFILRGPRWHF